MAKVKIKKQLTREEFDAKTAECVAFEVEQKSLEVRKARAELAIKTKLGTRIDACKKAIKKLTADCAQFAADNFGILFEGKKKSGSNGVAEYGFRLDPPALSNLEKRKDADACLLIRGLGDGFMPFLKVEYSLDKNAIKDGLERLAIYRFEQSRSYSTEMPEDYELLIELEKHFKIDQSETFFIDPKPLEKGE